MAEAPVVAQGRTKEEARRRGLELLDRVFCSGTRLNVLPAAVTVEPDDGAYAAVAPGSEQAASARNVVIATAAPAACLA